MGFDDGQKALIRELVASELRNRKEDAERLAKETAEKAIADREEKQLKQKQENTPFWKPWTKGQKQLSALGLVLMAGLFIYDKTVLSG